MDIKQTLAQAGFRGDALKTALAVAMAESQGNAQAHNTNAGTGDNSYGLFQINMLGGMGPERRSRYNLKGNDDLLDPLTNAKVAYALSKGGTDWSPWSTYKSGAYEKYLGKGASLTAPRAEAVNAGKSAHPTDQGGGPDGSNAAMLFQVLGGLMANNADYAAGGQGALSSPLSALLPLVLGRAGIQSGSGSQAAAAAPTSAQKVSDDPFSLLGSKAKLIGTPYHGTHTIGNWESDDAVDLGVPVGTPVYAAMDGKIGNQFGSLGEGGRFAGLRLHLKGDKDELYYAHLSKFAPGLKPGTAVKKGQLLGYSGEANGVGHLHLGDQTGALVKAILARYGNGN